MEQLNKHWQILLGVSVFTIGIAYFLAGSFTVIIPLLYAAWLVKELSQPAPASPKTEPKTSELPTSQNEEHIPALMGEISPIVVECEKSIGDVITTQDDAVQILSVSFGELQKMLNLQSENISNLIRMDQGSGELYSVRMSKFADTTESILDRFIESTVDMSSASIELLEEVNTIHEAVPEVLKALQDIDGIAS